MFTCPHSPLQPGGAGARFLVGSARCKVCNGQVRCAALRAAAAWPGFPSPGSLLRQDGRCPALKQPTPLYPPLQGRIPCMLCAGAEARLPPPQPFRPAGEPFCDDDEETGQGSSGSSGDSAGWAG